MKVFEEFCETIRMLRDPVTGCPWDLKQSHASLRRFMIEEAYEAVEAMGADFSQSPEAASHLAEELGDVLLQVVLNAQIAKDTGLFSMDDVIRTINDKMRRRHPHVFSEQREARESLSEESIRTKWEQIKEQEGKGSKSGSRLVEQIATISKSFPSTIQAQKIGRIAEKSNFDWDKPEQVLKQLRDEIDEVVEAMETGKKQIGADLTQENLGHLLSVKDKIAEEIGDVYFTLAQLCRHLGLDSEIVATMGNQKFCRRFKQMESLAQAEGASIDALSASDRERLWAQVKMGESAAKHHGEGK